MCLPPQSDMLILALRMRQVCHEDGIEADVMNYEGLQCVSDGRADWTDGCDQGLAHGGEPSYHALMVVAVLPESPVRQGLQQMLLRCKRGFHASPDLVEHIEQKLRRAVALVKPPEFLRQGSDLVESPVDIEHRRKRTLPASTVEIA
jgi:hypothetical protein